MADLTVGGGDVIALDLARAAQVGITLLALAGRDLLDYARFARSRYAGPGIAGPQYGARLPTSGGTAQ